MLALIIAHTRFGTRRQESHVPGAKVDIDATTPIVDGGFHLPKVFWIIRIHRTNFIYTLSIPIT
jgi:hypothetical protein